MFSRLVTMRYQNYTLFKDVTVNFNDNISIMKGMNSNGKSNVLAGIHELFTCPHAAMQKESIKFGEQQSILTATFSDGISVTKIKQRTGKTAYIMEKNGEELYSTIVDGNYTPVKEVPEPICKYLAIPSSNTVDLFYRKSRDKLLIVDTIGSENYEFLSSALNNKDISTAISLVNTDRLSLRYEVVSLQNKFDSYSEILSSKEPTPEPILKRLEELDSTVDVLDEKMGVLETILSAINKYNAYSDPSLYLDELGISDLKDLNSLLSGLESFNSMIPTPLLDQLGTKDLQSLTGVLNLLENFNSLSPTPMLNPVDPTNVESISTILDSINTFNSLETGLTLDLIESLNLKPFEVIRDLKVLNEYDNKLKALTEETQKCVEQQHKIEVVLEQNGLVTFRCQDCNSINIYDPKTAKPVLEHTHEGVSI